MCGTFEPLPSPIKGEGSGGGEDSPSSPPSPPSPAKGGRGLDLPLSAPGGGGSRWGWRALLHSPMPIFPCQTSPLSPPDVNDRALLGVRLGLTKYLTGDWCDIALTEQNEPQ
jgi:hypothetical protein